MTAARAWWQRHTLRTKILLLLATIATAGTVVVLAFVTYLFIGGFSGGNDPTSVTPVLFPISMLLFLIAGLPAILVSGGLWVGFSLSSARTRKDGLSTGK